MKRKLGQEDTPAKRTRVDDELAGLMRGLKRGLGDAEESTAKRARLAPRPRALHERKWAAVMAQLTFITKDTRMLERVCEVTRDIARKWGGLQQRHVRLQDEHARLRAENERLREAVGHITRARNREMDTAVRLAVERNQLESRLNLTVY
jgi:regulator of replication initiation timing